MIIAIVLIVLGLFFFARALGFVTDETLGILWPLLLVVIGLSMLSRRWMFGCNCGKKTCPECGEINWFGRHRTAKK